MDKRKQSALDALSRLMPQAGALCQWIHDHPELGFEEREASARLQSLLSANGFRVQSGAAGLETAFRAEYGSGGPRVALLCEFDALPGIGHACGHNVIGVSSAAAAIAAAQALEGVPGTIVALGTPAEEGGGGKQLMLDGGAMEGVDCALMFHPGPRTILCEPTLAICRKDYIFHGRGAHAGAMPHQGRSALEAVIQMFNNVSALRPALGRDAVVNGIITKGGVTTNIIPDLCEASFEIRACTAARREEVARRMAECAEAAALATGCTVEIAPCGSGFDEVWPSHVLVEVLDEQMSLLGIPVDCKYSNIAMASTDVGNLSHHIPAVHPMFGVGSPAIPHTPAFAETCSGGNALRMLESIAQALSLAAIELVTHPELVEKAKAELAGRRGF